MGHQQQRQLQLLATREAARKVDSTRHKVFISYHGADIAEVETFIEDFGTEFIAKTVGVTDEDDFIDSEDTAYVMDQIRTKYLGDSTVTIVLVGSETWGRRYADWEVYSSLRSSKYSSVNGLLALQLPGAPSAKLPERVGDNVKRDAAGNDVGYARYYVYPSSKTTLRGWISDAFDARTTRPSKIDNSHPRRQRNA